ncbi:adhesion domain-containing protein [Kluyvera intermedia]|uniref:adhesion domain-containing protein n=1 Tax=Kluyvera intermedia TaxID=61648 RepID=UPI003526A049
MDGSLRRDRIPHFLLLVLIIFSGFLAPVSAALKSGTWQEMNTSTDAINGTVPLADGVTIPVYQGSILLSPDETHAVNFSAMPRDFSTDDTASALKIVNPIDTEGDIFAVPPVRWADKAPVVTLTWADAATPDEPLNPQPVANQTFCAQNMAGKNYVLWPQLESDASSAPAALYLQTITGTPFSNTTTLLDQKIPVTIAAAVGEPVKVTADNFNETLKAARVKVGESITLTITTHDCQGNAVGNTAFVITRGDALNRQNIVNNTAPVHVGNTELTTTATEYHGTTDTNGNATVVITQANGPGVKTPLTVSPANASTLKASVDVIFTTLTSPDSASANMWGHMPETSGAEVDGETYTFSRPKLAAEAEGESGVVNANNENWALFNWSGADKHCDILPDARQLMGLKIARGDLVSQLGWPVAGTNEYWSSSAGTLASNHLGVNMLSRRVVEEPDTTTSVVSCVDKASPDVTPALTLTLDNMDSGLNAAKVPVGDSISMRISITDKETGAALPYRYFDLYVGDEQNRKGQTNTEAKAEGAKYGWDDNPVLVGIEGSGTPNHYHGITDANGQLSLELTQDNGAGVLTSLRVVLADGTESTANVIFTVLTSPDVAQARMWGHMQGVVEAGNIYKRPQLVGEATANTGSTVENHEDWATFNSVTAATAQCGAGQVPGQVILDALYSAHSGNAMLTTYGWPTASHSYISADTDGSQTAHVNLTNGTDAMFSGTEPNYLTCSGNELVTQLEVSMNSDANLRQAVAKVGEQITMTVHSINALNGIAVPNAAFTVTMAHGKNRSGLTTGYTDATDGTLVMGGESFGSSQASMTYEGVTDASGNATFIIEQPQGVGLLTQLTIVPVNSLITTPITRSVKFTVPTSPDTADAEMWGHMADTVTVDGLTFERPKLATEVSATRTLVEDNETWARVTHSDAAGNTQAGGCAVNRLPRADQLSVLYNANSDGAMHSTQGWPVSLSYWSATFASATSWKMISLASGAEAASGNASVYTACLASDNPVATTITIEAATPAQWSDSLQATKVKKGETLALKVTVKDANGNPLPGVPFVLSRGDGYTRQGTKHIAGSADGIVSPVVIDGESLNDTATKIGGITGADGSKTINVTRPETHGTKVAITAALYDNAGISDSLDTIFTVVTSPDSDKATMWGYMPETVTAASGAVFKRPQLLAEMASGVAAGSVTENNESWGTVDFHTISTACGAAFVPALADLQSLYSAWPGGAINTQQGWPLDERNYQNSTADLSRSTDNRYVKSLNLRDNGITSQLWSEKLYFSCLQNARSTATHLTLTSTLYKESDGFAKAKVGETIPVVITTLDDSGRPLGNTPVIFTRGDSVGRSNQDANATEAAAIQINQGTGIDSGIEYYTATGDDGTVTLDINQDSGAGFKTPLHAAIENIVGSSQSLSTVFTVITSPDTAKANYWGHMPETVTDSNGLVYKRPLLASESGSSVGKSMTMANGSYDKGETWGMFTASEAWNGANGCGRSYLPTTDNLQTLYSRYPDGAMRNINGWPMSNNGTVSDSQFWWSGDSVPSEDASQLEYAAVNLLSGGDIKSTTSKSTYYMQTCLASPRQLASKLTLTLANADETTGIAKVKKGEKIAATVMVTDTTGLPVSNALVKITRSDAKTRANVTYTTNNADDITLSDISSGEASTLLDTKQKYLYVQTDAQGLMTFNISQDSTTGLQTTISATLADDSQVTDSKNAIFTVITSPDTSIAKYWGHMPETFTNSKGVEFKRPLLRAELSSTSNTTAYSLTGDGEVWFSTTNMAYLVQCDQMSTASASDLATLQSDHPNGELMTEFGLPVSSTSLPWIAGNLIVNAAHTGVISQSVNLFSGENTQASSQATLQLCRVEPRTLNISLTSSLPWDANKAGYQVKKGEIIPLTIDVTDNAGQPQAGVSIKFYRGASSFRNAPGSSIIDTLAESYTLLEPVSPASDAVTQKYSSSPTYWYGTTDSNGKVQLNVSQDSTTGLRTEFFAVLADNNVSTEGVGGIFTVLTSPDVNTAFRWGHMPETVEGPDGVTYTRPKLQSEVPSGVGFYNNNNEYWAHPTAVQAQTAGATGCDPTYQPLLSDLQALYNKYPNAELETAYGWPLSSGRNWWAVDLSSTGQYQSLNLSTGTSNATTSSTTMQMQACRTTPHAPQPATIELTSSVFDAASQYAKVKKGETIPLTVTVKDVNGSPAANAAFTLSRGDGVSRSGLVKTSDSKGATDDLALEELTPTPAATVLGTKASTYSGVTGADGTATFSLSQDDAMGLKTTITAKLGTYPTPTSALDAIFTVVTSPDTDKAAYWGHMPETATNSAGVAFRRPLLAAEMASYSSTYTYNNEVWPLVTAGNTDIAGATGCDKAYQPLKSDMETLFIDNLSVSGGVGTVYGWPSGSNEPWWAGDKQANTGNYQYIMLSTGGGGSTSSSSTKGAQVCLVEPRITAAAITLTSTAMDTAKASAVAEKGKTIPLTVTVKDTSGNPVANASFTLSRGDSTNRAGVVITDGDVEAEMGADDLILQEVMPSSSTIDMSTTASVFNGTTGSDGTATFTLAQNKSLGLKTALTAALPNNAQASATLDNIFTVLTSPDTNKAQFWGHMKETMTLNGKTIQRPLLLTELPSGVTPPLHIMMNNEDWTMAHTIDSSTWDLAAQCGSLQKAPTADDLEALYSVFNKTGWPTTSSYSYLSQTKGTKNYCAFNLSAGGENCNIDAGKTAGFATCAQ